MPFHWRIQDFPEVEGANSPGVRQHTILPNFPKNCMKLKEFVPAGGGGGIRRPLLDPPLLSRGINYMLQLPLSFSSEIEFVEIVKDKVTTSKTLHHLPSVISHRYSLQTTTDIADT